MTWVELEIPSTNFTQILIFGNDSGKSNIESSVFLFSVSGVGLQRGSVEILLKLSR